MDQDKLAIIYDERCLLHQSPYYHAENAGRIKTLFHGINRSKLFDNVKLYKPVLASRDDITAVHSEKHYKRILNSIVNGVTLLDPDTYIVKESWEAARLAAGSAITSVEIINKKIHNYVFCLVRPPGHHAEKERPMGFCLFNNVAIGASYAIRKYKYKKVAIIDFDVHHGNGTQEIFYNTDNVLFISLHQFPLFPGTGLEKEKGIGDGEGFNFNFPLPAKTNSVNYLSIFENQVMKIVEKYDPELIMLSAGFDAHRDDPLADLMLKSKDYGTITNLLLQFAKPKNIPIISILEGGYNYRALEKSVIAHLKEFIS